MLGDTKSDALKRVAYIDGHIQGVRKMIDEDRYCVDVIRQTYAIRRALQKLESVLIDGITCTSHQGHLLLRSSEVPLAQHAHGQVGIPGRVGFA